MFRKILVPTDFSAASDAAFRYAGEIAARFGGSIHMLHVIEEPIVTGALGTEVFLPDAQVHEQLRTDAERQIDERLPAPLRARLKASSDIALGPTAGTIVSVAEEYGADLIVLGSHGRTGMAHLLLGSVAESVVRKAPCPVLTVPMRPEAARLESMPAAASAPAPA
jgi:nucleotide-binding universal stress UspA family protein